MERGIKSHNEEHPQPQNVMLTLTTTTTTTPRMLGGGVVTAELSPYGETPAAAGTMDFGEWHPQHLHEVVGVTMVVKNWMRLKARNREVERLKSEEMAAANELNTSLVFEPMGITMERIRMLKSSSSQLSLNGGKDRRSGSKISTATLQSIKSSQLAQGYQMAATDDKNEGAKNGEEEAKTLANREGQSTAGQLNNTSVIVAGTTNGSAIRERAPAQGTETTESGTTVGQERHLITATGGAAVGEEGGSQNANGTQKKIGERMGELCRMMGRTLGSLPNVTIDPSGPFYAVWTFLVYLVFLYNAFMCVLFVFDDTQRQAFFLTWIILNGLCDWMNLLDLFVNSRLSYMDDGMMVMDWKRLTKRYLRSWHFPMDLGALVPLDFLLLANRNISLARVNRLAKCYRVWEFVQMTNVRTNYPNGFRILHIVVVCLVLFHWNAALYFKISLIHGIFTTNPTAWEFNFVKNQDPIWVGCGRVLWDEIGEGQCGFNETGRGDPDTERANYVDEMVAYWTNRSELVSFSNFAKQYSLSFYWSSLTLTTSGQQPYPTAAMHNFLEIFDTIVGVLVFAVIVGSVGNVVSTMNRGRAEIQQLNDGIKFYMNYRNVSDGMQKRVLDCINYIQRHAQIQNEQSIMATIPPRLRGELAVHLHMETLRRVALFNECEPSLLYELVMRLQMQMFAPNDFLCRRGDLAKEMFVLKRGILEVFGDSGEQMSLEQGAAFGEMSILKPPGSLGKLLAARRHSLRSLGYSEVYLLSQEDALRVFADYPEQRQTLIQKAIEILVNCGEVTAGDLANQGPFNPVELCGMETPMEVLQMLGGTLDGLDTELDQLYAKFKSSSAELKKQVTSLEADYKRSREMIKARRKRSKREMPKRK